MIGHSPTLWVTGEYTVVRDVLGGAMQVRDLMTTDVVAVAQTTSVRDAARMMFRYKVSGLPVVDSEDHLVGIVTEADFLAHEIERADSGVVPEFVNDVMSHNVLSVFPDLDVFDAARYMQSNKVKRVAVVEDAKLVGVLSRFDIVAAFTRPDDLIEDEIREDLIRRVLFVDPVTIDVSVDNGVVHLGGLIGTRTEARLVETLTRRLDGVADVINDLTWNLDDVSRVEP